ncbi:MAG TPA: maleylpyruvate isomerase family mycothiol-dependent enzyme [Stackebrandtia sp.]|jgi:uncharacterized protein (TIGR03083 family)|uniref:maleylpyruvate isomerase family mycothiol-dependent enzyme n=1 Tax=Stackebrandtia sp. TaxID=2023065 RepID=UPI002D562975|nr:maleylpyruvate isomerase family mycothiol-dependent enzyme [Stackebrandtia sp.]HZE41447.1 maleylpyruvate isomerase family mycothiol-dependent enzyme [Stackebrandtia sp.]
MTDNPFDLLDAEAARVDRFFDGLTAPQWRVETRCAGWDRKDMAAHLIRIEDYIRTGLDDTVGDHFAEGGSSVGYERLNDILVERYRDTPVAEVLSQWRDRAAAQHPRLRERGVDGSIGTAVGDYPCGRQTFYFASEYAIHADDMGVPITADERAGRLRWRRDFTLDALREYGRVTVTAAGDDFRVAAAGTSARLTAAELVEGAAGRLPAGSLPEELRLGMVVMA